MLLSLICIPTQVQLSVHTMKINTMKLMVYTLVIKALFSLLLLVSGDVELNPGPTAPAKYPKKILEKYWSDLFKAISADANNVANALFFKQLITQRTREFVLAVGVVNAAIKADRVINDVIGQLDGPFKETQIKYFIDVCNVLTQCDQAIKEIGNVMLKELLGENTSKFDLIEPEFQESSSEINKSNAILKEELDTANQENSKVKKQLDNAEKEKLEMKEELDMASKKISELMEEINMRKSTTRAMSQELETLKKKLLEDLNQPLKGLSPPEDLKQPLEDRQKFMTILIYIVFFFLIVFSSCGQSSFIAPLPGVKVTRSTNVVVAGGHSNTLYLDDYGLVIFSPPDAIPTGLFSVINIRLSVSGPYVYPDSDTNHTMVAASPVYWLSSSKEFLKPLQLGIRHYTRQKSIMKVYTAEDNPRNMSYVFEEVPNVIVSRDYVYFTVDHFSAYSGTTSDIRFCGTLYRQKSPTIKYQWDYNYVMYICWKGHEFAKKNWSVEIYEREIEVEENSTEIELNLDSAFSKNWETVAKSKPLVYTIDNLLNEINTSNMQFSLQWKGGWWQSPTTENIRFLLKGTQRPKEITVTMQSISFLEYCKFIIILIFIMITAKYFPDNFKGTMKSASYAVDFVLTRLFLLSFLPEIEDFSLVMSIYAKYRELTAK